MENMGYNEEINNEEINSEWGPSPSEDISYNQKEKKWTTLLNKPYMNRVFLTDKNISLECLKYLEHKMC